MEVRKAIAMSSKDKSKVQQADSLDEAAIVTPIYGTLIVRVADNWSTCTTGTLVEYNYSLRVSLCKLNDTSLFHMTTM